MVGNFLPTRFVYVRGSREWVGILWLLWLLGRAVQRMDLRSSECTRLVVLVRRVLTLALGLLLWQRLLQHILLP